jgi:hypothetical protein
VYGKSVCFPTDVNDLRLDPRLLSPQQLDPESRVIHSRSELCLAEARQRRLGLLREHARQDATPVPAVVEKQIVIAILSEIFTDFILKSDFILNQCVLDLAS